MSGALSYFNSVGATPGENNGTIALEAQLNDALAELAAAATRVYYDATEDAQARGAYYVDIAAHFEAAEMFRALSQLLRTTHVAQPTYKPSKFVYPWVDLHPDLKVHSIYSDFVYDAENLIREDFRIEAERARRVRAILEREAPRDPVALQEEIDRLEAALPYNCEHSVPQSWFAKREPMRGDLHHLFACESRCNSFRGNHAYFDFSDFERVVRDDCGKREENRFEPASSHGKGAVARATLYFHLRYPGLIAAAGGEFDAVRLPLLLEWHRRTPPGEYERHRNAAIFTIQGNRNPLIDFPEWAERIDFLLGFGQ